MFGQFSDNARDREAQVSATGIEGRAGNRRVFDNSMTAHVWAQQTQSEGRSNNGNFYFRDRVIYSYGSHFPIAEFTKKTLNGKRIVLFTCASYSVSTSKHVGETRGALHGLPVIVLPVPDLRMGLDANATRESLIRAMAMPRREWEDESDKAIAEQWEALNTLTRSRAKMPADCAAYVAKIDARAKAKATAERVAIAANYIKTLPRNPLDALQEYKTIPEKPERFTPRSSYYSPEDVARTIANTLERLRSHRLALAKAHKHENLRKRASAAIKALSPMLSQWQVFATLWNRDRRKNEMLAAINSALANMASVEQPRIAIDTVGRYIEEGLAYGLSVETLRPLIDLMHVRQWEREHPAPYVPRLARKLISPEQWQNGQKGELRHVYAGNDPTLVRRVGDRVETSRGAEVPFKHAVAAYLRAAKCRRDGTSWQANGERIHVGMFSLDRIDSNGTIYVGCHTIRFDEMTRLAVREVPELVRPTYNVPACI